MTRTPTGVGRVFGYARVSTTDQDLSVQTEDLVSDGVHPALIFREQKSGTSLTGRVELDRVLQIVGPGDILTVTRLDRLARSLADLLSIMKELEAHGAHLRVIHQPVDTTTPTGRLFCQVLGAVAEFETALRRERQMEGIARAKDDGVYTGRPRTVDRARIREMFAAGKAKKAIARELGYDRKTVLNVLKEDGPMSKDEYGAALRDAVSGVNDVMRG